MFNNIKKLFGIYAIAILFIIVTSLDLDVSANSKEIIYDYNSSNFTKLGTWAKDGSIGYNLSEAIFHVANSTASATWKIDNSIGTTCRIYFWKTLSESASPQVTVKYSSESQELIKTFALNRGVSGWEEIGTVALSGAGATLTVTAETGKLYVSAIKVVPLSTEYLSLISMLKSTQNGMILQVNNYNAFVNGISTTIPDVPPTIVNGRTFVPLRFVTESIGASVIWDADKKIATVSVKGNNFVFAIGNTLYIVNGEEKTMDEPTFIQNDRLMLPLRVISEGVGKKVFWDPRGLIVIANEVNLDSERDRDMIDDVIDILNDNL